jgi:hypothetical protein
MEERKKKVGITLDWETYQLLKTIQKTLEEELGLKKVSMESVVLYLAKRYMQEKKGG